MKNTFRMLLSAAMLGGAVSAFAAPGLKVSGTDLQYNGKKIFFSGTNLAWSDYNSDVGSSPLDENAWRKAVTPTWAQAHSTKTHGARPWKARVPQAVTLSAGGFSTT